MEFLPQTYHTSTSDFTHASVDACLSPQAKPSGSIALQALPSGCFPFSLNMLLLLCSTAVELNESHQGSMTGSREAACPFSFTHVRQYLFGL